jgi:uncharacterized protein YjbI with pentapeptide repeats
MAGWGDDRAVPAEVLRQVLLGEYPGIPEASGVRLRGAVITGDLDLTEQRIPPISLEWCRFDAVCFDHAKFTCHASFDGASFTGNVRFNDAIFSESAQFKNSSFVRHASFGNAKFARAVFFDGATFSASAWFNGATFGHAYSSESKDVYVVASFDEARFAGDAWFERAAFLGAA